MITHDIPSTIKAIKRIIACFILVSILCFAVVVLVNQDQIVDCVYAANSSAKTNYTYFTNIIKLEDFIDVPESGIYVVLGESHDFAQYKAYAGDLFKQDTLLYGKENLSANGYWAIRIKNGIVVEAWSSNYPLNITQLSAYTQEEQRKQMHLFEKFSESKIIGYYCTDE